MHGYSKVPDSVTGQIAACASDSFYVGRAIISTRAELAAGRWEHLGVVLGDGGIALSNPEFVPLASTGRWSSWLL